MGEKARKRGRETIEKILISIRLKLLLFQLLSLAKSFNSNAQLTGALPEKVQPPLLSSSYVLLSYHPR